MIDSPNSNTSLLFKQNVSFDAFTQPLPEMYIYIPVFSYLWGFSDFVNHKFMNELMQLLYGIYLYHFMVVENDMCILFRNKNSLCIQLQINCALPFLVEAGILMIINRWLIIYLFIYLFKILSWISRVNGACAACCHLYDTEPWLVKIEWDQLKEVWEHFATNKDYVHFQHCDSVLKFNTTTSTVIISVRRILS